MKSLTKQIPAKHKISVRIFDNVSFGIYEDGHLTKIFHNLSRVTELLDLLDQYKPIFPIESHTI